MRHNGIHCSPQYRASCGWLLALLVVAMSANACAQSGPAGTATTSGAGEETTITISGAFALFPLATIWADEYTKLHPNIHFDIQGGGAGKGMTDMLTGAVDIAMLSREPRQTELDQGIELTSVAIDSVLGSISANNPNLADILAKGITPESGAAIWITQESKTWGDLLGNGSTDPINVYTRSDAAGAAESWAKYLGGSAQEELKGIAVNADPGLAEAVRQDRFGIGYSNVAFLYDPATGLLTTGLAVVPLDINEDGVISEEERIYDTRDEFVAATADGKYPFPPARVLYLVTKGEANPAIQAWYRWLLTEGQKFVAPAGYVALTQDRIDEALGELGEE